MYSDRHAGMPDCLLILEHIAIETRSAPLSSMSQKIATVNPHTRELSKIDTMLLFKNTLRTPLRTPLGLRAKEAFYAVMASSGMRLDRVKLH